MQKVFVQKQLCNLDPISLSGLETVKLLNRVDRKYIIPVNRLPEIIQLLKKNQYSVLEIDGCRAFSYLTTYFDNSGYAFFKDHHNHLSSRIKVRTRSYLESNEHFFEIKIKTNVRTNKYREALNSADTELSGIQQKKIRELYPKELAGSLSSTLINTYNRITLVNKDKTERCTIDVNLAFRDPESPEEEISVNDIAIIEVKQSKASLVNGIIASLRTMRIPPSSISKYVLGLILTRPELKHNSFKPLLHKINKIKRDNHYYTLQANTKNNDHEMFRIPLPMKQAALA